MSDTKTIDDAHLALGEPIAPDFSDYARKIRNNLIVVGVISGELDEDILEILTNFISK